MVRLLLNFVQEGVFDRGDPLSPYIFVLCIECPSHGISRSIQQGHWKPIRLARIGTPLIHLFFLDDLLWLSKASSQQVIIINKVIDDFSASSGAKVNKSKTLVYFSTNISAMEASSIGSDLDLEGRHFSMRFLKTQLLCSKIKTDGGSSKNLGSALFKNENKEETFLHEVPKNLGSILHNV